MRPRLAHVCMPVSSRMRPTASFTTASSAALVMARPLATSENSRTPFATASRASATIVSALLSWYFGASVLKWALWLQKLQASAQRPDLALLMPQVFTKLPLCSTRTAPAAA